MVAPSVSSVRSNMYSLNISNFIHSSGDRSSGNFIPLPPTSNLLPRRARLGRICAKPSKKLSSSLKFSSSSKFDI